MIGSYGSGSNRPHTEDELAKARQALSLLKAHKARGETAAQRIGTYIMGGGGGSNGADPGRYKKATTTAYETKFGSKPGNTNYRKVFNPVQDQDDLEAPEEEKRAPMGTKGRLEKVNKKYNNAPAFPEPKAMSNLANLGKKALSPVNEVVSNEFGTRPPVKNPVKRTEPVSRPPPQKPARKPPPMPSYAPPPVEHDDAEEDRPIKPAKSSYPIYDEPEAAPTPAEEPDEYPSGPMGECKYCQRKFNPESLVKHQKVCQSRPDKKKRKEFDSKKARLVSEEQKKLVQSNSKKAPSAAAAIAKNPSTKKMPKWKIQSAQFRNAMKATKGTSESGTTSAYNIPPEADEQSLYTQCPTCGRSFNEEAAKRHIPFCANKAKMDAMKNGGKAKATMQAKAAAAGRRK